MASDMHDLKHRRNRKTNSCFLKKLKHDGLWILIFSDEQKERIECRHFSVSLWVLSPEAPTSLLLSTWASLSIHLALVFPHSFPSTIQAAGICPNTESSDLLLSPQEVL